MEVTINSCTADPRATDSALVIAVEILLWKLVWLPCNYVAIHERPVGARRLFADHNKASL